MKKYILRFSLFIGVLLAGIVNTAHAQNIIQEIAGTGVGGYSSDHVLATSAKINGPSGVSIDGSGNIYFADYYNNRIRKIDVSGIITTVAGTGAPGYTGDGAAATNATLNNPDYVFVDASGNVLFTDYSNHAVRKINGSGIISTICGNGISGFTGDGFAATGAQLNFPTAVCGDVTGNIYISDASNSRVRKINTGGIISTIAGNGVAGFFGEGIPATNAMIYDPFGLTVDVSGNLYIADQNNNRVRMVNPSGIISTFAGSATGGFSGDGSSATLAKLNIPTDVSFDAAGNLFIADRLNNCVRKVSSGIITTVAGVGGVSGSSGDGGAATTAKFNNVPAIHAAPGGRILISDFTNNRIRELIPDSAPYFTGGRNQTMTVCESSGATAINSLLAVMDTDAGQPETWTSLLAAKHGTAVVSYTTTSTGGVLTPTGLSYTPVAGYVGLDSFRVEINDGVEIDSTTIVVTVSSGPNPGIINGPSTLCPGFTMTLSDTATSGTWSSSNTSIATITSGGFVSGITAGNVIISYAVTGTCGTSYAFTEVIVGNRIINTIGGGGASLGDGGPATSGKFVAPPGICIDASGNVLVTDFSDNRVRKITPAGIITTIAGNGTGGSSGDGSPATSATVELQNPEGICTDVAGNIYICEQNGCRVRKINTSGIISTIFGTGSCTLSGDGGLATLTTINRPTGIAVDVPGNIYVCEWGSAYIRMINPAGIVSTIAGNGVGAYFGDGVPATTAELNEPYGLSYDGIGNLFIGDESNNRVRQINLASGIITTIAGTGGGLSTGDDGPATAAQIGLVNGVYADPYNVYFASGGTHHVRVINRTSGIITNVAGTGTGSFSGDGGLATAATLHTPAGVAVDANGNVYIADFSNARVREVTTVPPSVKNISGTPDVICVGLTISLSDTTTGGAWTSTNTSVATVGTGTGVVTGMAGGTATISYTVPFECGPIAATQTVTVLPGPLAITPLSASVCVGNTVALSDPTSGGVWTSSATTIATVGTGGVVTGGSAGTATITYTIGTCTALATITVNAMPSAGTITGLSRLCAGSSVSLTDATGGGVWSSTNTAVATVTGGVVHGLTAGTTTISYTVAGAFCTAAATQTMTVDPLPAAGIITGSTHVCLGATTSLTDVTASGGIGVWSSTNTSVSTVSPGGLVTGVGVGTDDISYTLTSAFGCITSTFIPDTVNLSPGPISGTPSVCIGSATILTDGISGGTWSSSNTTNASVTGGVVSGLAVGTSTISYTMGTGTSSCIATMVVTVISSPAAIVPATASVCTGSTVTLSDVTAGGTWASSNTTSASVIGGVVSGVTAGTTTITYTVGGCYAIAGVTVNTTPAAITPSGAVSVCAGSTTTLSDVTSGGAWSSSATATATVAGGVVSGVSAGSVNISYISSAGCSAIKTVTVNAAPVAIVPATATVCTGFTTNLSDATSGGLWSSSATGTATVSGGLVSGIAGGTATITYAIGTCIATAAVTVNATPAAITPSGAISVCAGTTTSLSDVTSGGAWSSSATAIATVTGGLVSGVSAGSVNISYTSVAGCFAIKAVTVNIAPTAIVPSTASVCPGLTTNLSDAVSGGAWSSSATGTATVISGLVTGVAAGTATITYAVGSCIATATVTVNTIPVAITPSGAVGLCAGTTTSLSDATSGGLWSSSATATATVGTGGVVTGVSSGSVNISYTNAFGCYVTKSVTVNTAPTAITPSAPSVCPGSTINLSDAVSGGAWSSSATGTATVSGGLVTGIAAGTATITYAVGTCIATTTLTVNPIPLAIAPLGAASVCVGGTTALTDATSGGLWSSSATATATVGTSGIVTGVAVGSVNISYANSFGCAVVKVVTVNTAPTAILPLSPQVCAGSTLTLSDAVSGGAWASSATATATIGTSGIVSGIAAGTATIIYNIGSCSITTTVTVNPLPVAGSITGASTVCAATTINLSDAAAGGVWSSGTTTVASVGSGTGVVTGLTAGTSAISYTVINSCGTARATATVTVITIPNPGTVVGVSSICAGTTAILSDAVAGGTWKSSNLSATISGTGLLTGITPGLDTISYSVTNTCGTGIATKTVTVGAFLTAGTISGLTTVCAGSTIALSDPATGGVWSSSNTTIVLVGTSGVVVGIGAGLDTVSYTVTASCGSAVATHTVTVRPLPVAGSITGPALVCAGTVNTYSDAAAGGVWSVTNINATITGTGLLTSITPGIDTIIYKVTNSCGTATTTKTITIGAFLSSGTITGASGVCAGSSIALSDLFTGGVWSSGNTAVALIGTSGIVSGVSAGMDTISYTVTAACGTATSTHAVTVNPLPFAGSISGSSVVCIGTTITLTDTATGGVWSSSNTNAAVSGGVVTPVAAGTVVIRYSVTNVCGTATASKTITTGSALTAGGITGASIVCAGASVSLSDTASGGVWSSGNTGVAIVGTGGIVTGTGAGIDTITYTFTNVCGIVAATATVTVDPLPVAGSISGASSVCIGSTITLSDPASGGVWGSSNSDASVSGGVVTPLSTGTDTISYTVTNSCGIVAATKAITIGTSPTVGAITGPSGVCLGSAITLSDATAGGAWSSSNTAIALAGTGGIVSGASLGTANINYTVSNGCGTAVATATISVDLAPNAGAIVGPASICAGTFTIYTDAAAGGVWTSSNTSATITSLGGVLNAITPLTLDTVVYTVTNGCGTAVATKPVSIGIFFSAGTITGPSVVCTGVTIPLSDATPGGVWSRSNANVLLGTTGIVTGVTPGIDTISYTITAACGIATATKTITINASPNAGVITGSSIVCVGSLLTLTDATSGGVWSSSNVNATVTTGGVVTGVFTGADTISYSVSNSCGIAAATKVVSVGAPAIAGTITGAGNVCAGTTDALTDASGGGFWSSSNTAIALVGSTGIVTGLTTGSATITYAVATICSTAFTTMTITVNSLPNAGTITGLSTVCVGSLVSLSDAVGGGVWSSSNANATITTGGVVTGIFLGVDTISYTVTNLCGISAAQKIMTVNTPASAGTITGAGGVCVGSSIPLSDAIVGGTWTSANTAIARVGTSGIVTGLSAGADVIIYTITSPCGITSTTATVTVNPLPDAGAITGSTDSICIGTTVILTDAVAGGVWSAGNTNASVTVGVVTGLSTGTDPISYTVANGCGTTSSIAIIAINTTPVAGTISGPASVCAGSGITLTDPVPGGIWLTSNADAFVAGPGIIDGVTVGTDTIFYQVTNGCGTSVASKIIPVNPVPVVSPVIGSGDQCNGSVVTLTDGVTGGIWTSSNTAVASISISGGVTTAISTGTATITYTVTNIFGCPTSVLYNDTVIATPVVPGITGITSVCAGSAATLSDALAGGAWSSGNTAVATIDAGTGVVTGVAAGTSAIDYTVINICGSNTVSTTETVHALPVVAAISGAANLCTGATTTLSDATSGGAWSSTDTTIARINAVSGAVTAIAAGTANMVYTVTNGFGCTASVIQSETVNAFPVVAVITGPTHECIGVPVTLADITGSGTWSSSNTAVATVDAFGDLTTVAPGNVAILYTVNGAFGCNTTVTAADTVAPIPVIAAITGSNACIGEGRVLTDDTTGGFWSSGNTAIATIDAGTGTITGVSAGSVTIVYSVVNVWGCADGVSAVITVNPLPAITPVTSVTDICSGQTLTVSDATVGGAWSSSNTAVATVSGAGVVTGVSGGTATIIYMVTGIGGCTNASSAIITIGAALPTAAITPAGSATLCHGDPLTLNVIASGGAFTNYQWLYNGAAIPGATASSYTTNTAGKFSVIAGNGICSETIAATTILAPPDPVILFTAPDVLYTGSFSTYQWFLNGKMIAGANSSTLNERAGGLYTVVVTDINGCTDTAASYKVNSGSTAGVNGVVNNTDVRVYPNPATSMLHIDASVRVNVKVYSIDGKMLIQQKDATDIDISNLANGMYMIMIYDENDSLLKTAKFAKVE